MEQKKKRGRPRNCTVYKSSLELIELYQKKQISFESAVRLKTAEDCNKEVMTLPKSLCNEDIYYANVYPWNLGREYRRFEFFRAVNVSTGEIKFLDRYMSKERFKDLVNNSKYILQVCR